MTVSPITSFEASQKEWDSVLRVSPVGSIFLSPQWQQVWWENFGDGREMTGFSVPATGGGMDALASLARRGDSIGFVGAPDTFDYNDFLVRPGFEETFYPTLLDILEEWEWSEVRLDSLIEDSPTLAHLPGLARSRGYAVDVEYEDVTSGVALDGDWDSYLARLTKKDRHELRRKLRRLESHQDWRWYCLTDPDDVEASFDDFLSLMRMSRTDKEEYMTPERESSSALSPGEWPNWTVCGCSSWTWMAPRRRSASASTTGRRACCTIAATTRPCRITASGCCCTPSASGMPSKRASVISTSCAGRNPTRPTSAASRRVSTKWW